MLSAIGMPTGAVDFFDGGDEDRFQLIVDFAPGDDPLLRLNAEYAKQFGVETPGWPSRPT